MDKHLLATNPLTDNGHMAIVRTIKPISIYEVLDGHVTIQNKVQKRYLTDNGDEYTLFCVHIDPGIIDINDHSSVFKYMDDAWYYFKAYKAKLEHDNL